MLVKCLNCGHEFHGEIKRDELGKHSECEKCGSTFDVTEPELEFTLVNCEGKEIRKTYDMVEDFKNEMKSDEVDIPMLDDIVKDMTLWGVHFENDWDVAALLNYLK